VVLLAATAAMWVPQDRTAPGPNGSVDASASPASPTWPSTAAASLEKLGREDRDDGSPPVPAASEPTANTTPAPPRVSTPRGGVLVSGVATWYRWRVGQAAAGPGLRKALGKGWRGRVVWACPKGVRWSEKRCARVRLTDWCLCSKGNRVVDLDRRSFAKLADPSRGILAVDIYANS
jgi:hypothetical protein